MRYATGEEIMPGDLVLLAGRRGAVVFSLDADGFTQGFHREEWAYLGRGVMIEVEGVALVHAHGAPDPDLTLIARAK